MTATYSKEMMLRLSESRKHFLGKVAFNVSMEQRIAKEKNMFMRLMNDNAMQEISTSIHKHWKKYFNHISESENINMYEASKKVFLQTACEWTGIPLKENEIDKRAEQLSELFENAASVGLQHWKSRR